MHGSVTTATTKETASMRKYENKESFAHKTAKELLHKWLQQNSKIKFINSETQNSVWVGWNYHFVFMEYPITKSFPQLIDETDCKKNMKISTDETTGRQTTEYKLCSEYRDNNGTFCPCTKCKYLNSKIEAIADIAIGYKGIISNIFEIKHKHPTPNWKKEKYLFVGEAACEIESAHILGQIQIPERLFIKRIEGVCGY